MTKNEILALFKDSHALLDGHFQLTSGLHSRQYFQCAKVLQYPRSAALLCEEIARHFAHEQIDIVIAPAIGGIVVAQEVGRILDGYCTETSPPSSRPPLRILFTERKDGAMQLRRGFSIGRGERVLVCEDVVTTGGSVQEVITIVENAGGEVIGVGAIVDRSGGAVNFNGRLFATVSLDVTAFPPDACPMCGQGMPVDKPGSRTGSQR